MKRVTAKLRLASRAPKWPWAVAVAASVAAFVGTAIVGERLGWWDRFAAEQLSATTGAAASRARDCTDGRGAACRLPHEGRARASGRPSRRAGRGQRPRPLSRHSRAGTHGPSGARRRFVGRGHVVRPRRRIAARRLAGRRGGGARSHPARGSRRAVGSRFSMRSSRARLAALAASPRRRRPRLHRPPAAATELDSVLSLAAARLRRGQLLSPAGDSARAYLDRATELGPPIRASQTCERTSPRRW